VTFTLAPFMQHMAKLSCRSLCQDDATVSIGASDVRPVGHPDCDAPGGGQSKKPKARHGLGNPPRKDIRGGAATRQAISLRRTLQVFVHGARIGDLHNASGVWSFCYARARTGAEGCRALTSEIPSR
jgi:hypothetical protein